MGRPQGKADGNAAAWQRTDCTERPRNGASAFRPHFLDAVPGMAGYRGGEKRSEIVRDEL